MDQHFNRPHLVYVLNKSEYLNKSDLNQMKYCIHNMLKDSKLLYKNSIGQMNASSHLINSSSSRRRYANSMSKADIIESVNFVTIPKVHDKNAKSKFTINYLVFFFSKKKILIINLIYS